MLKAIHKHKQKHKFAEIAETKYAKTNLLYTVQIGHDASFFIKDSYAERNVVSHSS